MWHLHLHSASCCSQYLTHIGIDNVISTCNFAHARSRDPLLLQHNIGPSIAARAVPLSVHLYVPQTALAVQSAWLQQQQQLLELQPRQEMALAQGCLWQPACWPEKASEWLCWPAWLGARQLVWQPARQCMCQPGMHVAQSNEPSALYGMHACVGLCHLYRGLMCAGLALGTGACHLWGPCMHL